MAIKGIWAQMNKMYRVIIYLIALLFASCSQSENLDLSIFTQTLYEPMYAQGFSIKGDNDGKAILLTIKDPWQGAEGVEQMLLIDPDNLYDGVTSPNLQRIDTYAKRIVCLSSSYVAMLSAIGSQEAIVGVSGIDFISDSYVAQNRDKIGDVGYDNNFNYEMLLSLKPDIVLLFGISAASTMEVKLKELGIPYVYIGDYIEQSPLGKAEWMVAIGEIVGKRDVATTKFEAISNRYNTLAADIKTATTGKASPQVMLNTPYREAWFTPTPQSYMVRLINDAGGKVFTTDGKGNESQPINIEQAYTWASQADVWLNLGGCNTLDELKSQNPKFAEVKAITTGRTYNNNARQTATGGSDFWESGVVNPDRILYDLAIILHPELKLSADGEKALYYYKPLR